ncbi:MAG: LPS export ABC transporter periplasmic protein LptC [bacterium]|nr:LPS export ABC transporter periplasmic protein LptC [bacterium]
MKIKATPLILFSIAILFSCEKEREKSLEERDNTPPQETYNIHLQIKEYEAKRIEVFSEKATYSGDTIHLIKFKVNFFDKGEITATMVGDTGTIVENSGFMEARGKVKLTSTSGDSLISNILIWNQKLNLIYSPSESFLYKENKTIRSSGLESDPALKAVKFKGKVYVE